MCKRIFIVWTRAKKTESAFVCLRSNLTSKLRYKQQIVRDFGKQQYCRYVIAYYYYYYSYIYRYITERKITQRKHTVISTTIY